MDPIQEEIGAGGQLRIFVEKRLIDDRIEVSLRIRSAKGCYLHWGLSRDTDDTWHIPPESYWPEGTKAYGDKAIQTPFMGSGTGKERLITIRLDRSLHFSLINFVLFFPDENRWDNNHGKDYHISLPVLQRQDTPASSTDLASIANEIIHKETGTGSWTLMHRFNLCYDLIERVGTDTEGLALIYVWLRFSAIRQLTWQRRYNTQPRELTHAMDRLTLKLCEIYIQGGGECREMIRMLLTTLGRGGEGQVIRDEFLNIMHRNKIKEVPGTFLEEWHQKIHNNATPDDIVLCDAYLAFLRSDGDLALFYRTLEEGGVTRERLEGFERPIVEEPGFYPEKKGALIEEFERYLKILKAIHAGTDLDSAIESAGYLIGERDAALLQFVQEHRGVPVQSLTTLTGAICEIRSSIKGLLAKNRDTQEVRDLIYLDLSLEGLSRMAVERQIHNQMSDLLLIELIEHALSNLLLSYDDSELAACQRHWSRLKEVSQSGTDWPLHAMSVLDRTGRATGRFIDRMYQLLQPKAELLGEALKVGSWTIPIFSEEVVRGMPPFVLSLLMRHLNPMLRKRANLGNWQVVSPGEASGSIKVVETLEPLQGKTFSNHVVLIARSIRGNEEIPEGVTAIISPDETDIISHIAVRARNSGVLFATCYDRDTIGRLASSEGRHIHLAVSSGNGVIIEWGREGGGKDMQRFHAKARRSLGAHPGTDSYALALKDFDRGIVGGKSFNLKRLWGRLPRWIHLPASVALPFGVFERVLEEDRNGGIRGRLRGLIRKIGENPGGIDAKIRATLEGLEPPDGLVSALRLVMDDAGLKWPENWGAAWRCITGVWASKWNERACISRSAWGIPDEELRMAVLIQEVVEADYAFVIHTADPVTGDRSQLYAEVVLGLGETLVGNHPGRGLGFISAKRNSRPLLRSYPSKGIGLYGKGLIFRSDSNAEDLEGYAGAGLYESIMLEPPRQVSLDYSIEPLVWDDDFRRDLLLKIAAIGAEVEIAMEGCPQDIEGVVSKGKFYVVQARPQVGLLTEKKEGTRL